MTTADWIRTRRGLLDAASPRPWELICGGEYVDGVGLDVGHHDGGVRACDAELIADARSSLPLALDALEAVLTRHQPINHGPDTGWVGEPWTECCTCQSEWPCATVDAIDTALAGGCGQCRQIDGHHKLDCGRRS